MFLLETCLSFNATSLYLSTPITRCTCSSVLIAGPKSPESTISCLTSVLVFSPVRTAISLTNAEIKPSWDVIFLILSEISVDTSPFTKSRKLSTIVVCI